MEALPRPRQTSGKPMRKGVVPKNYPLWNHHLHLGLMGQEEGQSPEPSEGTCGLGERDLAR